MHGKISGYLRVMEAGHSAAAFPVTRWSLIAAAGTDNVTARRALGELCQLYWFPLYAFARRQGFPPPDAEDATQAFLTEVAERNLFGDRDPSAGRMRSYLLAAFRHDLHDARRAARRQKRGGGAEIVSIDAHIAESRLAALGVADSSAEGAYERHWALTVLEAALARLEGEYVQAGKGAQFSTLRPWLNPDDRAGDGEQLAAALGVSHAAARQTVHRFRERFARSLRSEIADTLRDPTDAEVEAELLALRQALSR